MRQIALGIVITGLISTSAWAEEPAQVRLNTSGAFTGVTFSTLAASEQTAPAPAPAPEPPAKKVTGTVGADIPTAYYFRGYRQEFDPQFTIQPFIDVAIAGDKASFNVGLFNSFHTGTNKDAGYGYYETDFYAAATVHNIKATYTAYTYPKIDDSTIQELMFSTSFANALAPSVALAFELAKPAGLDKGIYLELGVNPAVPMKKDAPIAVTIPVKLGLGLKDYYFDENGDDTPFGYFSAGVSVSHPLSHGDVHGSVLVYGFGDSLKGYNIDKEKSAQVVGSVGFTATF
jgi:hypothetical protein